VVLRLSHAAYLFDVIMLSKKTTNLLLFQTCHGTEVIGFHIMSNFSQTVQPHLQIRSMYRLFAKKIYKTQLMPVEN
jgi:hypothetical protein